MTYIIKACPRGQFDFNSYYCTGSIPLGGVPEINFTKNKEEAFKTNSRSYAYFVRNYLIFKGNNAKIIKLKKNYEI